MREAPSRPVFLLVMNFKPRLHRPLEHWLIGLAQGLAAHGAKFHVILSAEPVEWWASEFTQAGGEFSLVPEIREKWRVLPVLKVLRRVRPKAMAFIFVPMGDPRTWLLARWPGLGIHRRLFLDHNSWAVHPKTGLMKRISDLRGHLTSRAFDEFISISEYNLRRNVDHLGIDPAKSRVIPNGVLDPGEISSPTPAEVAPLYVFYVGQLTRDKGVHTLLAAWAQLRDDPALAGVQLWLAGAGKQEAEMRALAGSDPSIRFLGLRNDVPNLMRGALTNVIPSEWAEGFGLTAAEALAAARPLIVSDAGALPEVVGHCGVIFQRGNVSALSAALAESVAKGRDPLWTGDALRQRYETHYRLERMTKDYLERFLQALL